MHIFMHACMYTHACVYECVFVYVYTTAIHVIVFGCVSVIMCVCVCVFGPGAKFKDFQQGKQVIFTDCLLVIV